MRKPITEHTFKSLGASGGLNHHTCPSWWTLASEISESNKFTRSSIATRGAHAGVVGGGEAQPVGKTQGTLTEKVKGVATGNCTASSTIAAG